MNPIKTGVELFIAEEACMDEAIHHIEKDVSERVRQTDVIKINCDSEKDKVWVTLISSTRISSDEHVNYKLSVNDVEEIENRITLSKENAIRMARFILNKWHLE